jgi:hypothetical protein
MKDGKVNGEKLRYNRKNKLKDVTPLTGHRAP